MTGHAPFARSLYRALSHLSLLVPVVCAVFFAFAAPAFAQFSASIQGTGQDSSGSAIPSATVTLTNVDTGVKQTATSDSTGVYRFASLAPGNYEIAGAATGF